MSKTKLSIAAMLFSILAGCGQEPPPPTPSEIARSNLYKSWNLGTVSIAGQFDFVNCGFNVESDTELGETIRCSAKMKGYLNNIYFQCSIKHSGRCRTL
jgi:hypothetical protein